MMNREVRRKITTYKSCYWQSFLATIREKSDRPKKAFWAHLSRVYKSKSLPCSKLDSGHSLISKKKEIVDALFSYYENQFKITETDEDGPYDAKIEEEYRVLLKELSISEEEVELTSVLRNTKLDKKA